MSVNHHTPIPSGSAANASIVNAPIAQLDQAISNLVGGAGATVAQLKAWTESAASEMWTISYNATYERVVASASVIWPDGSNGTFTTTAVNTTWEAVDAYTITHVLSNKTVTQAAVTRNATGSVEIKPPLTVA
jgi:hypothetical protein